MSDTWRGFTPEQMTEKLRECARNLLRASGSCIEPVPEDVVTMIEAADLIDWLVKRVAEVEQERDDARYEAMGDDL